MEYSWQFDPLIHSKSVELTCDGTVIATTTLYNAEELARKLNAYTDLYEALKAIREHGLGYANKLIDKAIAKAEGS